MKRYKYLSWEEMMDLPVGQNFVFDIEIYRNFLFIAFKVCGSNQVVRFGADENNPLHVRAINWFINRHRLIGFNSTSFDLPLLAFSLSNPDVKKIKAAADKIIIDGLKKFEVYEQLGIRPLHVRHIDLIEVCPLKGSLKLYGARLHAHTIRDLPVNPENFLSDEQKEQVADYCCNDLFLTDLIFQNLQKELSLREKMSSEYKIDLMSSSDAQIAEKVIRSEITKVKGKFKRFSPKPDYSFEYEPPSWVCFRSENLKLLLEEIEETDFELNENGSVVLPESLSDKVIKIGSGAYRMGVGGLHSSEKRQVVEEDDNHLIFDVDVASYYPAIILNNKFYPKHIGEAFLEVYKNIVERRLKAKASGDKEVSNSLKIVINGLFGKFGNKWSCVYSPKLLIQVTLTGQLALLMLIEYAEQVGIKVVSANTDGIVFYIRKDQEQLLRQIVSEWENHTNFQTEYTKYKGLYSRDVNSYIAVKEDDSVKTKGSAYLLPKGIFRFHKNPDCNIVSEAVCGYLSKGESIVESIRSCSDITKFLIARNVAGGAEHTGEKIGKVVRWYYSRHSKSSIFYLNGNKVSRSENSKVLQTLPEQFPEDLDYEKYIELAKEALIDLGVHEEPKEKCQIFSKSELDKIRNL